MGSFSTPTPIFSFFYVHNTFIFMTKTNNFVVFAYVKTLFTAGDAQGNPVLHPHPLLNGPLSDCGLTHQQLEDGQVTGGIVA